MAQGARAGSAGADTIQTKKDEVRSPLSWTLCGAGEGNRTLVASLEGWCFTTKLHPHVTVSAPTLQRLRWSG